MVVPLRHQSGQVGRPVILISNHVRPFKILRPQRNYPDERGGSPSVARDQ